MLPSSRLYVNFGTNPEDLKVIDFCCRRSRVYFTTSNLLLISQPITLEQASQAINGHLSTSHMEVSLVGDFDIEEVSGCPHVHDSNRRMPTRSKSRGRLMMHHGEHRRRTREMICVAMEIAFLFDDDDFGAVLSLSLSRRECASLHVGDGPR